MASEVKTKEELLSTIKEDTTESTITTDKSMRGLLLIMASLAIMIIFVIIFYLFSLAGDFFNQYPIGDFFLGQVWAPNRDIGNDISAPLFGAFNIIMGTLLVAIGALLIAIPLGIATAVFIAEVAPKKIKEILKGTVEVLAGIPSVIFGYFGRTILNDFLKIQLALDSGLCWLNASFLLAIMALPTIVSVCEDAIDSVPQDLKNASLAMGATRWQTISKVVIPAAMSGITAGIILGMGRALGETITVTMVAGNQIILPEPITNVFSGVQTITATLALEIKNASGLHRESLFALGIVLFIISLIINLIANLVLSRIRRKFTGKSKKRIFNKEKIKEKRINLLKSGLVIGLIIGISFGIVGLLNTARVISDLGLEFVINIEEIGEQLEFSISGLEMYKLSSSLGGIRFPLLVLVWEVLRSFLVGIAICMPTGAAIGGISHLLGRLMNTIRIKKDHINEKGNRKKLGDEIGIHYVRMIIRRRKGIVLGVLFFAFATWLLSDWFLPYYPEMGIYYALLIVSGILLILFIFKRLKPKIQQIFAFAMLLIAAIIVLFFVGLIVYSIFENGLPTFLSQGFLTEPSRSDSNIFQNLIINDLDVSDEIKEYLRGLSPIDMGGVAGEIIGTLELTLFSILFAVPIGILAGIYLSEYAKEGPITRTIRLAIASLNGTPSIVFGLFGYVAIVLLMEGRSLFAGTITLALMILPVIIITTEEGLKAIPQSFREGSLALGSSKWHTISKIALPAALPAIITGIILAMGRVAGETAPILFTAASFTQRFDPWAILTLDGWTGETQALTFHLYKLILGFPDADARAGGVALTLLLLVLSMYLVSFLLRSYYRKKKDW
ncbi:MAG: membrane protein of unknown function [Promethearchaeota archaeon]|nr:MAG: membrane protein of unknown function [Candidatus Lokiarchaeota archaeon]